VTRFSPPKLPGCFEPKGPALPAKHWADHAAAEQNGKTSQDIKEFALKLDQDKARDWL